MTVEIPHYYAYRTCSKCGGDRCSTQWRPKGGLLWRRCPNCNHGWAELPLDHPSAGAT